MASQSTSSTGVTRITGTYSGLDVDSLVKAGLAGDQSKLDKAKQSEQIMEWRQEQYRTIMSDVTKFTNKYLTGTGENSLTFSSDWNTMKATSDNAAVTVTASTDAPEANYTVNVTKLATAASSTINTSDARLTTSNGSIVVTSNGKSTTITLPTEPNTYTQEDKAKIFAKYINSSLSSAGLDVSAKYSDFANGGAGGIVFESKTLGSSSTFTIDGASPTIAGQDAVATIKDNASGVTKTYQGNTNQVTYNNTTFKFNNVTPVTKTTTTKTTADGITDNNDSVADPPTTTTNADGSTTTKGTIKPNATTTTTTTITTSSDGKTTTTIVKTTDTSATPKTTEQTTIASSNPTTISTTKDVSTVADKITSFVDDYNTLMKEINGKIYETYNKSYAPLTDEQRKAMSDSEITKWETKAKTGLLRKDDYLTNLASDMKEVMTSMMKGSGLNLEKIGISPVEDYGSGNGTYVVKDKSKLTSALQNNFDKVYELFNSMSSDSTATKSTSTDGILSKLNVALYNNVTKSDSKMAKKAGVDSSSTDLNNEMTKVMKDQKTLIDTMEDKLKDKETSLYNKYSALETKLSSLDSSSSYLTSMLG